MPFFPKVILPLTALLTLGGGLLPPSSAQSPPLPKPPPHVSPLGAAPAWTELDAFQSSITRSEFERLVTKIFTTGDNWQNFIALSDDEAVIAADGEHSGLKFHLRFAPSTADETQPSRQWRTTRELPPATAERPLEGLRIAIDPGHIGGEWAKMEERQFDIQGAAPIKEGDMTLIVARLLKPRLESLGATVSLVRNANEPLTPLRPEALLDQAATAENAGEDLHKAAERLFYRTAEIRARAELVNQKLKPDLVLCLHFNAEPWGGANSGLVNKSHFHIILNGGYNDQEVAYSDQRFEMLRKLLTRTHAEEAGLGADVAAALYSATGLPPYTYQPDSKNARTVDGNPYLWARNLLANRLYDCPVIFMEPYVMNSRSDYPRMVAGDYEGQRDIGGKMQPSIFQEYADAVTAGLKAHYTKARVK